MIDRHMTDAFVLHRIPLVNDEREAKKAGAGGGGRGGGQNDEEENKKGDMHPKEEAGERQSGELRLSHEEWEKSSLAELAEKPGRTRRSSERHGNDDDLLSDIHALVLEGSKTQKSDSEEEDHNMAPASIIKDALERRYSDTDDHPALDIIRKPTNTQDLFDPNVPESSSMGIKTRIDSAHTAGSIKSVGTGTTRRSRKQRATITQIAPPGVESQTPQIIVTDGHSSDESDNELENIVMPRDISSDGYPRQRRQSFTYDANVDVEIDSDVEVDRGWTNFDSRRSRRIPRGWIPSRQCPSCKGPWQEVVYVFDNDGRARGECISCRHESNLAVGVGEHGRSGSEEDGPSPLIKSGLLQVPNGDLTGQQQDEDEDDDQTPLNCDWLSDQFRLDTSFCGVEECKRVGYHSYPVIRRQETRSGDYVEIQETKVFTPGICQPHFDSHSRNIDELGLSHSFLEVLNKKKLRGQERKNYITETRCLSQTPGGFCFMPKRSEDDSCDYCYMSERLADEGVREQCSYSRTEPSRDRRKTGKQSSPSASGGWSPASPGDSTWNKKNGGLRLENVTCRAPSYGWFSSIRWDDNGQTPWCIGHQQSRRRSDHTRCSSCHQPNPLPKSWMPLSEEFYQLANSLCDTCLPHSGIHHANSKFAEVYSALKALANDQEWDEEDIRVARKTLYGQAPWMTVLDPDTLRQFSRAFNHYMSQSESD